MNSELIVLPIESSDIPGLYSKEDISMFLPGIIMSEFCNDNEYHENSKEEYMRMIGMQPGDTGDIAAMHTFYDAMCSNLSEILRNTSLINLLLRRLDRCVISEIRLLDRTSIAIIIESI